MKGFNNKGKLKGIVVVPPHELKTNGSFVVIEMVVKVISERKASSGNKVEAEYIPIKALDYEIKRNLMKSVGLGDRVDCTYKINCFRTDISQGGKTYISLHLEKVTILEKNAEDPRLEYETMKQVNENSMSGALDRYDVGDKVKSLVNSKEGL